MTLVALPPIFLVPCRKHGWPADARRTDLGDPALPPVLHIFSTIYPEGQAMSETSAVELHVRLPQPLVDEVERVRESDPEALSRIVAYGVTRRAIFEYLVARGGIVEPSAERGY